MTSLLQNFLISHLQCERFEEKGCKGKNTEKCEKIEKFCDCIADVSKLVVLLFNSFSKNNDIQCLQEKNEKINKMKKLLFLPEISFVILNCFHIEIFEILYLKISFLCYNYAALFSFLIMLFLVLKCIIMLRNRTQLP